MLRGVVIFAHFGIVETHGFQCALRRWKSALWKSASMCSRTGSGDWLAFLKGLVFFKRITDCAFDIGASA